MIALSRRIGQGHRMRLSQTTRALYSFREFPAYDATKHRQWVQMDDTGTDEGKILVMSYNLLSQHYVWDEIFGDLNRKYLEWNTHRFPLINHTIAQFKCDIMCFQEMEFDIYQNHWKHLSEYTSIFVKKSLPLYWGEKPNYQIDGVSIFVNKNRFDIVDSRLVNFGNYIIENKHQFEITDDLVKRVVPRNTVAVLVKLYDKLCKKTIYVTNTHLYWSPKFNDVKLIQTKILLNILSDFTSSTPNPHIIMAGDFNSNTHSWVIQLLSSAKFKLPPILQDKYGHNNQLVDGNNTITNQLHLHNTYQPLLDNNELAFTSYTTALTDVLDHIFVSKEHFKIAKLLGPVNKDYCATVKGFPNEHFPSDHIPLVATINYVN